RNRLPKRLTGFPALVLRADGRRPVRGARGPVCGRPGGLPPRVPDIASGHPAEPARGRTGLPPRSARAGRHAAGAHRLDVRSLPDVLRGGRHRGALPRRGSVGGCAAPPPRGAPGQARRGRGEAVTRNAARRAGLVVGGVALVAGAPPCLPGAVVGAGAVAIPVLTVLTTLLSEPLFGLLVAAAVILADRPPPVTPVSAGAAGLAAALALLTRSIGVAAGAGVVLFLLLGRGARWKPAVSAALPVASVAIGWALGLWPHAHGIDPGTPAGRWARPRRVSRHSRRLALPAGPLPVGGPSLARARVGGGRPRRLAPRAGGALVAAGAGGAARRRRGAGVRAVRGPGLSGSV